MANFVGIGSISVIYEFTAVKVGKFILCRIIIFDQKVQIRLVLELMSNNLGVVAMTFPCLR